MPVNNVESMNYAGTLFSKVKEEAVRQKINFSIFDANKDGKFSISELESACEELKLPLALPKNPAEQPTKDITIKYKETWFGNFVIYYDEVGNPLKSIHRNQDNKITKVLEGKDEKGHWKKRTDYAADGKTITSVFESPDKYGAFQKRTCYAADGKRTKVLEENKQGTWQKRTDYEADGKIARVWKGKDEDENWQKLTHYASDGKTVVSVWEGRDENGNWQKMTDYAADGKTVVSVWEGRDENGNWQKRTYYAADGKIARVWEDRDENGNFQKRTDYAADGTIARVWEDIDENGNFQKRTDYAADGKTVWEDRDENGNFQKRTDYAADGKTVWEDRDENGNWQKQTDYAADGTIARVWEDRDENGNFQKRTDYAADGKTIVSVLEGRDENEKWQKQTNYAADGKTIARVWECPDEKGNWQKTTHFTPDGSTILFDRINNTIKCEYRGTNQYNEFISPDMPEEYKQAIRILINNCPSEVKEILRKEKIKIEIVKADCCDAAAHYKAYGNIIKMHIDCLYVGTFIHELGHALHYVKKDYIIVQWDTNSLQDNKAYCDAFEREVSEYVNAGNKRFRYGKNGRADKNIDNEGAFYGTADEEEFFACFYQAYYGYPKEGWTLEMLEKVFPDTTKEARKQLEKLKNLPDSDRTCFQ